MPFSTALAITLRAAGRALNPETLGLTQKAVRAELESRPMPAMRIERDQHYGPNPRHRLDLFLPEDASTTSRPVLMFVHGGGFLRGDKQIPDSPFFDNIAAIAVRGGMIAVNMTYRLAPDHMWPAGAEDVCAATSWLKSNIAKFGGDPARVFLMGTSAGAAHVAGALAGQSGAPPSVAGAIFVSGIFDPALEGIAPHASAYFTEPAAQSAIPGLLASQTPLLFVMSELDPPEFHRQTLAIITQFAAKTGSAPALISLRGHNHFSSVLHLNSADTYFAEQILDFCGRPVASP